VTNKSWEEDVRSIESMVDRGDVLTWTEEVDRRYIKFTSAKVRDMIIEQRWRWGDMWDVDGRRVEFTSAEVRDRIIELFADSVRTDGEYVLLCWIIGKDWSKPIDDRVRERMLHNIIQPFVWRNGLDTVDLLSKYEDNLDFIYHRDVILSIRK
jgi:hypothetical protein